MMLKLNSQQVSYILISIQFVFVIILFQIIPNNENLIKVETQINQLKHKNQQLEKKISLLSEKSNLIYSKIRNDDFNFNELKNNEFSFLTKPQVIALIELKIESIITEEFVILRNELKKMPGNRLNPGENISNSLLTRNQLYINKNYESVNDEYFKFSLALADEIIDRAVSVGEFTEWDADELNNATLDLAFDDRVFIMNKLSHAYNSQKINGKFIQFKLVNRSSEN